MTSAPSLPVRPAATRGALILFATLIAVFTAAGLLRAFEQYAWNPIDHRPPLFVVLRWRLWDWWFWIPATVALRSLVRHRVIVGSRVGRVVAANALVASLVVVIHRLYSILGMVMFTGIKPRVIDVGFLLPGNILLELVTYAAVVAACVALSTRVRDEGAPAPAAAADVQRIEVKSGARRYYVATTDVLWVEADGYCARLHTRDRAHVVRASLRELETQLGHLGFVRAHRSALVSLRFVKELQAGKNGALRALLENGASVAVSRDRVATVRERLASSPVLADTSS